MKERYRILLLTAGVIFTLGASLASCQREEDIPDPLPGYTLPMSFQGEIVPFDEPTKAGEPSFWDGATIYVRLENGGKPILGQAVCHSETGWSFTYSGSLQGWESARARCYFTQSGSNDSGQIPISPDMPFWSDEDAYFSIGENSVSLTATLRPMTGRLSLGHGISDNRVRPVRILSGLTVYTAFNLTDYTFSSFSGEFDFQADRNNYLYAVFTDPDSPSLRLQNGSVVYERTSFGENTLQPGHSGYFTVPTFSSHEGWTVVNVEDPDRTEFTVNGVSFKMIAVQGGTFMMGKEGVSEPVHQVTLDDYKIGETEVTQELWQAVMGENPSGHTGDPSLPVEKVTYSAARVFAFRLSELTGVNFRLPTEAEWEFAARERGGDLTYSGSDYLPDVGWYGDNSDNTPHPVKSKAANALGIFDMSGNVYEMVSDGWGDYPSEPQKNPRGSGWMGSYVIRGGGSGSGRTNCYPSWRTSMIFDAISSETGFRLACGGPDYKPEMVDLGLPSGLKWASFDLGASRPSEVGWYFSWGETAPKVIFNYENYKYIQEGATNYLFFTKYTLPDGNTDGIWYQNGVFVGDNKKILDFEDDAPRQLWGEGWRTPSPADWQELFDQCTWEHIDGYDGFWGKKVTGPNGNSIFLPDSYFADASGWYLTSSLSEYSNQIRNAWISSDVAQIVNNDRYLGLTIRPVYGDGNNISATVSTETVDIGVVPAGKPASGTVTVQNTGYLPLTITATCSGNGFSVNPAEITIPAGVSQNFTVTFQSASAGDFTGMIDFSSEKVRLPSVNLSTTAVDIQSATYEAAGVSFTMIALPAGSFRMGKEGIAEPVHNVSLDAFWMGETEVTQELWTAVMGSNPSANQSPDRPVECVTWWDVQGFLNQLRHLTGVPFRLPTEAEWEYAAREAGKRETNYSGSDNADEVAWYYDNSGNSSRPVKSLNPNGYGLYDMSGNVWEWCSDFYSDYTSEDQVNPRGNAWHDYTIVRGCAYDNNGYTLFHRNANNSSFSAYNTIGFRLALGGPAYGPEKVDLGLPSGNLWSTVNMGASLPEEFGDYYAWGETEPKWTFNWYNYKYMAEGYGEENYITKYTFEDNHNAGIWYENDQFIGDGRNVMDFSDDPARTGWGEGWRMPSLADWQELTENCRISSESIRGMSGYRVTSNLNGNSIFLPLVGYRDGNNAYNIGDYATYYHSSSLSGVSWSNRLFYVGNYEYGFENLYRYVGNPVRPIWGDGGDNYALSAPTILDAGTAKTGKSREVALNVRNTGYLPITFHMEGSADGFTFSPTGDITLPAGTTRDITLTFSPTESKRYEAIFRIVSDRLESPLDISVSGAGWDSTVSFLLVKRKYRLHYADTYCYPKFCLLFDNGQSLSIQYTKAGYYDGDYQGGVLKGVHIYSTNEGYSYEQRQELWNPYVQEEDTWVQEQLQLYPDGSLEYFKNGQSLGTYSFSSLDMDNIQSFCLLMTTEGWYTRHEHWMDDFYIFTSSFDYSDNFDSGVFDTSFWETPVNPDGVRVEEGMMKTSQLRIDEDFRLYSKTINL